MAQPAREKSRLPVAQQFTIPITHSSSTMALCTEVSEKVKLSSHPAITTGESSPGFFSFTTLGLAWQMHYHQQTKWRATGRS